ncbi:dof zinc finger protein DOF2.2 isoform X2 [Manihot esculenta]|uniref:Dof-type domain-containing protein n=2 Tax=Manihot esculenta TaxID=3983 RepID=A0A2C9VZ62_MANES|nr:dof zinc finger protein DOF2.2 isoform X2 [Manihot esculenta]OAY51802.1 hypothetical protein MANES_04G033900v8 [Manihot esculenta]
MVFSSAPVYLDPPNWQQQPNQQGGATNENLHLPPLPLPPPPHVGDGGIGSVRPGSMADRARLAKIPLPETTLKCPRGGALRNVPVGGGCRRNKKNKSQSRSKSPASSERQMGSCSNSTSAVPSEIIGHFPPQPSQLPLMTSLHNLTQFGIANLGLNFGGIQGNMGANSGAGGQTDMGFQIGSNSGMSSAVLSTGGVQQFPFFEPTPTGLYPFQTEGVEASSSMVVDTQLRSMTSSSRVSQLAPVKMEDNHRLNLSKPFLGISESNQYWSGNTWTDLSGLNSSSSSHLL